MAQRLDLQTRLEECAEHVYFQPPPNVKMQYPCIVYKRDTGKAQFGDNLPLVNWVRYEVIVVDRDPDSPILGLVSRLPSCVFNRHFVADNLNHDVFQLYWKGMTA